MVYIAPAHSFDLLFLISISLNFAHLRIQPLLAGVCPEGEGTLLGFHHPMIGSYLLLVGPRFGIRSFLARFYFVLHLSHGGEVSMCEYFPHINSSFVYLH
jgi:hypothetical protein